MSDAVDKVGKALSKVVDATIGTVFEAIGDVFSLDSLAGEFDSVKQDLRKDVQTRGAIDPKTIVYGEALVSGTTFFSKAGQVDNSRLYHAITMAGHEVESFGDVHLDGEVIAAADIDYSTATVTGGDYAGAVALHDFLGTATQAASGALITEFPSDWTSAHQAKGIAYLVISMVLNESTESLWEGGAPRNVRVLVKGKKIYDPRRDPSSSKYDGAGSQTLGTESTYEWSDNPVLCLANYMTDANLGMGFPTSMFDWDELADEADKCDATVSIPSGGSPDTTTEKRYTCNGAIKTTVEHEENVAKLLSSFNGRLAERQGKLHILVGSYTAPTITIDESFLAGDVAVRTSPPKRARFNTARAYFTDPNQSYKPAQTVDLSGSSYLARDNSEVLLREFKLPFTNTDTMAQRICMLQLQQTDEPMTVTLRCNYKASKVVMHEHVYVTISELGWSSKLFRVIGWRGNFGDLGGIELTLKEDSSGAYADPAVGSYATTGPGGEIIFPSELVPPPTNLAATGVQGGILVTWTKPTPQQLWQLVEVWASADNQWANATRVGETASDQFFHVLSESETRYYWVRASRDGEYSIRDPDSDTTTVSATALSNITVVAWWQNSAPTGVGERENDHWFNTTAGAGSTEAVFNKYISSTWTPQTQNGWAWLFSGGDDPAVITRGICHIFWRPDEPTDADCPSGTGTLGEGDLWFFMGQQAWYRYSGTAWVLQGSGPNATDAGSVTVVDQFTVHNGTTNLADLMISSGEAFGGGITAHYILSEDDNQDQFLVFNLYDSGDEATYTNVRSLIWYNAWDAVGAGTNSYVRFPWQTNIQWDGDLLYGFDGEKALWPTQPIRTGFYILGDSLTAPDGVGNDPISWANTLVDEGTITATINAANGRGIVQSPWTYVDPGATRATHTAIIHLGSNDATGSQVEATFKSALNTLIDNFQTDGWDVILVKAPLNDFTADADQADIRTWMDDVAASQGVPIWDVPTGAYLREEWSLGTGNVGIHMTQAGHNMHARQMYEHMLAYASLHDNDDANLNSVEFQNNVVINGFTGGFAVTDNGTVVSHQGDDGIRFYNLDNALEWWNWDTRDSGTGHLMTLTPNLSVDSEFGINTKEGATTRSFLFQKDGTLQLPSGIEPQTDYDAATKKYVDDNAGGITFPIVDDAGTEALPGYTFDLDTDTGMYHVSAGAIGFSSNGSNVVTINGAGMVVAGLTDSNQFSADAGAVGSVAFGFDGETNTGLYKSAAGAMGFSSQGTNVVTINSAGMVVAGLTDSNQYSADAGAVGSVAFGFDGETTTGMWKSAAGVLNFSVSGSEVLELDSNGAMLQNGRLRFENPDQSGEYYDIEFSDELSANPWLQIKPTANNSYITISAINGTGTKQDLTLNVDGTLSLPQSVGVPTTPSQDYHAASKKYVDDNAGGISDAYNTIQANGGSNGTTTASGEDTLNFVNGTGILVNVSTDTVTISHAAHPLSGGEVYGSTTLTATSSIISNRVAFTGTLTSTDTLMAIAGGSFRKIDIGDIETYMESNLTSDLTDVTGTLAIANGGTGTTTSTGTGSVVLSTSPTFTGTINANDIDLTGQIYREGDTDTYIDFATENAIKVQGGGKWIQPNFYGVACAGDFTPNLNNTYDLGSDANEWAEVWATDTTINSSDARFKRDIIDVPVGLDFINELRPVSYKWLEGKRDHYGLIAQEVKQVMDKFGVDSGLYVEGSETGRLHLRYGELISPLIKAVQELSERVKELESRL